MIQTETIRSSSLGFKLERVAKALLEGWLDCASSTHAVSLDQQQDLAHAVMDLSETLADALNALVANNSENKAHTPGWSYGFVCGFVQGNLNVRWSNLYLVQPSAAYADLMKLKAVREIINLNEVFAETLARVYSYLMQDGVPTEGIENFRLPENVLAMTKDRSKRQDIPVKHHVREIADYFEIALLENYQQLLRKYRTECCPDLCRHFVEEEFVSLIGKEHFPNRGTSG